MLSPYWVFSHLIVIIAARRCGMLAKRRGKCSAGISAHLSSRAWWRIPRFWVRLSLLVIAQHNSSKICSMGLHSGDLSGCSILVMLPSWRYQGQLEYGEVWRYQLGSSVCLANNTKVFCKRPLYSSQVSVEECKRRFGTSVKSSPALYRTTTSLDRISLAPLLEVLAR